MVISDLNLFLDKVELPVSSPQAAQFLQLPRHRQLDTLLVGKYESSFHSQSQYLASGAIHHVTPDSIV